MIKEFYHNIFIKSSGVSTDTRTLSNRNVFIALTGDNFDGNKYIQQALENGASHVVTSDQQWKNHPNATVVTSTLDFLQNLATYHRIQLDIPIIALTGSNGKTTTKELILSVLETSYNVSGTKGNLNNHIGVPLTLLSLTHETEIGVVEMGANHMKEISKLSSIACPDYGLITNYGKAHLEGFGSEENIKIGKSELYDYLREKGKTSIIGNWDEEQHKRSHGINCIPTIEAKLLKSEPFISFEYAGQKCETQLTGSYNFNNMLFAITIGDIFNIPSKKILHGISNYLPQNNRSQLIEKDGLKIILDAYNANPSSMEVALYNISKQQENPKTVILGDMFELGPYAHKEHEKIAQLALELGIDNIHLVGESFSEINLEGSNSYKNFNDFKNHTDFLQALSGILLIKGSRGMALERILDLF